MIGSKAPVILQPLERDSKNSFIQHYRELSYSTHLRVHLTHTLKQSDGISNTVWKTKINLFMMMGRIWDISYNTLQSR